ncbi:VOC family protein [Rhizobium sp. NZLR3b]|uniref:VOC family protein n=1 Tax=Rhizobium sp. NZLR3b TaxID=2731101 RepID=UPI001C8353FC|nr:VOC family protein [Rhizobium sp. NZLR3b]
MEINTQCGSAAHGRVSNLELQVLGPVAGSQMQKSRIPKTPLNPVRPGALRPKQQEIRKMGMTKPKLMGLNHVALEVDDVDAALEFNGKVIDFQLRGSHRDEGPIPRVEPRRTQEHDTNRHCGLVVNDRSIVIDLANAADATVPVGRPFNFLDP